MNETKNELLEPLEKKEDNLPTLKIEVDKSKSLNEQAKDVVSALATNKAIQDDDLVKDITDAKKKELSIKAKSEIKKEMAEDKSVEKSLQTETFKVYEGISSLIGLKRELPKYMLRTIMCIEQVILGLFYVVIGTPIGIINIILDGIDAVTAKFTSISQNAKVIVKSLSVILFIAIIVVIINLLLQRFFNFSLW